jgi:1,4-dihydroxy-2-naphthoate octaprenyltransferase
VKPIIAAFDWLLRTKLFLACCAVGLCISSEALINGSMPRPVSPLHALVFGSSLIVYNLAGILRRRNVPARRWKMLFFTLGIAMVVLSARWLAPSILELSAGLGLFSLAYSYPLLPLRQVRRLREIGWLKILVLAGVWTTSTSILPLMYWHRQLSSFPYEILMRFVLIFVLCFVFDMRDIRTDREQNIYTLPYVLGERYSYRLINACLGLFVVISVVQYARHPISGRLAAACTTAVVTRLIIEYLRRHPSERAYNGLVDGIMLLYAIFAALHI